MSKTIPLNETLTIGEFIQKLQKQKPEHSITFDFCGLIPTEFDSSRGSYEQLALGYLDDPSKEVKVAELLKRAEHAQHGVYMGYKGGSFLMNPNTLLWCDNYGR